MTRLRIGVAGAGLIAQVEHIPNILRLGDRFELVGVADPSPTARRFVEERFDARVHETVDGLLRRDLDALLVATPEFLHTKHVLEALSHGLHVFCEKPLCYAVSDAQLILDARNRAQRIVQVGYMKRFDPSYEAALDLLPNDGLGLRYISVEVNDPDAWPFVGHHALMRGEDVPAGILEEGQELRQRQVEAAVGRQLTGSELHGFTDAYCSALVHDVNAVHGMLDRMRVADGEVVGAQIFAGGDGGLGTVRLLEGRAVWQMVHLSVPSLAAYRERIALYFDDALIELVFPSPYLNHQATRLTLHRSTGGRYEKTHIRESFEEAFVRELEGFWSAIVEGAPVRSTVEDALRDLRLLARLARLALAGD